MFLSRRKIKLYNENYMFANENQFRFQNKLSTDPVYHFTSLEIRN